MLVIRFLRTGKRNQPSFSIVVTQKERGPQSGRFVEKLGFYSPLTKERRINRDRVKYWLSVGAKPSASMHNILIAAGIIEGKKIPVHKRTKRGSAQGARIQQGDTDTALREETMPLQKN